MENSRLRIAIVAEDKCKPKKCRNECKRYCPVVRTGKLCIEVDSTSKIAFISEPLCIGCGICVKKCPFEAISIINLPKDLGTATTHRFSANSFKLHRLPTPKRGMVLGLVGTNGIGKSTALKILSGKLKPNLGKYDDPPSWEQILKYFRGSEIHNYLSRFLDGHIKPTMKPQYVDNIPKSVKGKVSEILLKVSENDRTKEMTEKLELDHLLDRQIGDLSGGELQRLAICVCTLKNANVFMYDEPSSYLDVKQRLKAAQVIRQTMQHDNYIIVVEHDLSVLDYLSDSICCLWGAAGCYGVVTTPFGVREGINIFLDGFIPTENMRFREESLTFKINTDSDLLSEEIKRLHSFEYPNMVKTLGDFRLHIKEGDFSDSEIIVMLGENGTGKSTFIKLLAGMMKADNESVELPDLQVSYKPQTINPKFEGTVRQLFQTKIRDVYNDPQFQTDVVRPLCIDSFIDQEVQLLSGGELQRVALIVALGKPASIYLIDEPSAYLDSEQRIMASKIIKRFILHSKKTAFVVEHDFIMATYLADRVIVFDGQPGKECEASSPEPLVTGMNRFLKCLEITFRRDPTNFRPRINKLDSVKDKEQKITGNYFMIDDDN